VAPYSPNLALALEARSEIRDAFEAFDPAVYPIALKATILITAAISLKTLFREEERGVSCLISNKDSFSP